MMVQPAVEENEAEVRRVDQDNINGFARLNARLHDLRDERSVIKVSKQRSSAWTTFTNWISLTFLYDFDGSFTQKTLERLDDASTELMMASGDSVMLLIGESFFDTTEDDATEFCEQEVERMQGILEKFTEEEAEILEKQADLKKTLYARFGKSIQLEEK